MAQYETVNGNKYEKDMLGLARQAKGPIDWELAEQIWHAAMDGNKVTDIERDTVQYLIAEKECTASAKHYFHHKLGLLEKNCPGHLAPIKATGDSSSQYQTIAGLKYERDLFNHAISSTKGGKAMTLEHAKELWTKAMDGNKVTDTEFRTVEFVTAHYRLNRDAHKYLEEMLTGQEKGKTRTFQNISWIPEEEEKEGSDEPAEKKLKVVEPPKELEEDAAEDKKPKFKGDIEFPTHDTTLNLMSSTTGNILTSLSDGGLRSFLAGARASAGIKSGRYMFEVQVLEHLDPAERSGQLPKSHLRVGFSTTGSSLFQALDDSVCFDSDGIFMQNKLRQRASKNIKRGDVVAIVLNLDSKSPNANTISCFVNGVRASQPQSLPEKLQGKTLFPTITFRHLTLHVNFGPKPLADLPFKCRMVQEASNADVEATATVATPQDGKYEVVYPVGLPDEGTFEWLDTFLEKNPHHTELSDRKIVDWARQSGLAAPNSASLDKPGLVFAGHTDDGSVRRALSNIAAVQRRNYVVMEVRGNFLKEERTSMVRKFQSFDFKRVAQVVVGEPSADFKKRTQQHTLKRKQEVSDMQFKVKKLEEAKKKAAEKKQKEMEKRKRKAVKTMEAKKKLEAEKKKRAEAKEEAMTAEEETTMAEVEDSASEAELDDKMNDTEEPPKVELTAEEKSAWFIPKRVPDMAVGALSSSFSSFSLPQKDDGFDEIRYEWQKGPKCEEYLKKWILTRKLTTPMQDLKPSMAFNKRWSEFKKVFATWTGKHKTVATKTATLKTAVKKAAPSAEKAATEKSDKDAEKPEEQKEGDKTTEDGGDKNTEEDTAMEVLVTDVFAVEDVCDVGDGKPLFVNFGAEDWALLSLRVELHLLVHAFREDANDPERPGMKPELLSFYYNKYFKKQLSPAGYGVESAEELIKLVRDAIYIDTQSSIIDSMLPSELDCLDVFLKLTEEARRHRQRRFTLGEETAKLNFSAALKQEFATQGAFAKTFAKTQQSWARQAGGWGQQSAALNKEKWSQQGGQSSQSSSGTSSSKTQGWSANQKSKAQTQKWQMAPRDPSFAASAAAQTRPAAAGWGKGAGKVGSWPQKPWQQSW